MHGLAQDKQNIGDLMELDLIIGVCVAKVIRNIIFRLDMRWWVVRGHKFLSTSTAKDSIIFSKNKKLLNGFALGNINYFQMHFGFFYFIQNNSRLYQIFCSKYGPGIEFFPVLHM